MFRVNQIKIICITLNVIPFLFSFIFSFAQLVCVWNTLTYAWSVQLLFFFFLSILYPEISCHQSYGCYIMYKKVCSILFHIWLFFRIQSFFPSIFEREKKKYGISPIQPTVVPCLGDPWPGPLLSMLTYSNSQAHSTVPLQHLLPPLSWIILCIRQHLT